MGGPGLWSLLRIHSPLLMRETLDGCECVGGPDARTFPEFSGFHSIHQRRRFRKHDMIREAAAILATRKGAGSCAAASQRQAALPGEAQPVRETSKMLPSRRRVVRQCPCVCHGEGGRGRGHGDACRRAAAAAGCVRSHGDGSGGQVLPDSAGKISLLVGQDLSAGGTAACPAEALPPRDARARLAGSSKARRWTSRG